MSTSKKNDKRSPKAPETPKKPVKAPEAPKVPEAPETLSDLTKALMETKTSIKIASAATISKSNGSGKSNLNRFPSLKRLPKDQCTIKRLVGDKHREPLPVGAKMPVCCIPNPADKTSTFVVYVVTSAQHRVPQSIFRLLAPKSVVNGEKLYACPTDANSLAAWAKEAESYGIKLIVKAFSNAEAKVEFSKLRA